MGTRRRQTYLGAIAAALAAFQCCAPAAAQSEEPERRAGLRADWQTDTSHATVLGQVDWSRSDHTTVVPAIDWVTTTLPFYEGGPADHFAVRLTGKISVPASGFWTFNAGSDDGLRLFVNGSLVVNDDAAHSFRWRNGSIALQAGDHDIEVLFMERTGSQGLRLQWRAPGTTAYVAVPASAFWHSPTTEDDGEIGGLRAYWTTGVSHASSLSHIDWTIYDSTTLVPNISWSHNANPFFPGGPTDWFAARIVGSINIPAGGDWTFRLGSDAGARLFIDGQLIVQDDADHNFRYRAGTLSLAAGQHDIEVQYLERTGSQGLVLTWRGPGDLYESIVPPSALTPATAVASGDQSGPPGAGINAYWHTSTRYAASLGMVAWGEFDQQTTVPKVYWRPTSAPFLAGGPGDHFGVALAARLLIPRSGDWTFSLGSDAGARLLINGNPVVIDEPDHGFRFRAGTVTLPEGEHDIDVHYLERTGNAGLILTWQGPGQAAQVVPASAFRPRVVTPATGGGLTAYWIKNVNYAARLGQIDWSKHDESTLIDRVNWPSSTTEPFYENGPTDNFAVRMTGTINIPRSGNWTLSVGNDGGARLYIDGELLVNDEANHSFRTRRGARFLTAGKHNIEIRYLERTGAQGLVLSWSGPGQPEVVVPSDALSPHAAEMPLDPLDGGLRAYWTPNVRHAARLGHVDWGNWDFATIEPKVSFRPATAAFNPSAGADWFAVRFRGRLLVPRPGPWSFSLGSDSGARLLINGELVVNDDADHTTRFRTGTINLDEGPAEIEVQYLERAGSQGVILTWQGPGDAVEDVIPSAAFEPGPLENPPSAAGAGITAEWYVSPRAARSLTQIDWSTPAQSTDVGNIAWRIQNTAFYTGGLTDYFAARFTGRIRITEPGPWTFNLGSDAGAQLLIDGLPVITDDGNHGFRFRAGTTELSAGVHTIEVRYMEVTGTQGLLLTWRPPSAPYEEVIPAAAFITPQARILRWKEVSAVDER